MAEKQILGEEEMRDRALGMLSTQSRGWIGVLGFVGANNEQVRAKGEFCVYYESELHRILGYNRLQRPHKEFNQWISNISNIAHIQRNTMYQPRIYIKFHETIITFITCEVV